ncbi:hypothetical protein BpHYR1_047739 [Brachionus plicatilis]|uniref:Uncharacterized protein n=1 Tax=Brachionus plicatilis TaxID=10195 RepID=A0A3M7P5Z3_BRAPC|nr:hypothetical protein BpHYR1_047739 [Brachionus plicatilis]
MFFKLMCIKLNSDFYILEIRKKLIYNVKKKQARISQDGTEP